MFSCIKKLKERKNCNRNLRRGIDICICVMCNGLVFLFLELVLHGNYCSQQLKLQFPSQVMLVIWYEVGKNHLLSTRRFRQTSLGQSLIAAFC